MAKNFALRGLIFSKFKNESAFAEHIGWSRQKLMRITNGIQEPNIGETRVMANALGVDYMDIVDTFFDKESPNG